MKGGFREKVTLATKFGVIFSGEKSEVRGDPNYVRSACEASLRRLGVDYIDLYYQHRIDSNVPIEITVCFFLIPPSPIFFCNYFKMDSFFFFSFLFGKMQELKKLVEEGKIKYVGLSEASASTIRRAHSVHPLTAVQLEWSLWSRDAEKDIISTCRFSFLYIYIYMYISKYI